MLLGSHSFVISGPCGLVCGILLLNLKRLRVNLAAWRRLTLVFPYLQFLDSF